MRVAMALVVALLIASVPWLWGQGDSRALRLQEQLRAADAEPQQRRGVVVADGGQAHWVHDNGRGGRAVIVATAAATAAAAALTPIFSS